MNFGARNYMVALFVFVWLSFATEGLANRRRAQQQAGGRPGPALRAVLTPCPLR